MFSEAYKTCADSAKILYLQRSDFHLMLLYCGLAANSIVTHIRVYWDITEIPERPRYSLLRSNLLSAVHLHPTVFTKRWIDARDICKTVDGKTDYSKPLTHKPSATKDGVTLV